MLKAEIKKAEIQSEPRDLGWVELARRSCRW